MYVFTVLIEQELIQTGRLNYAPSLDESHSYNNSVLYCMFVLELVIRNACLNNDNQVIVRAIASMIV